MIGKVGFSTAHILLVSLFDDIAVHNHELIRRIAQTAVVTPVAAKHNIVYMLVNSVFASQMISNDR